MGDDVVELTGDAEPFLGDGLAGPGIAARLGIVGAGADDAVAIAERPGDREHRDVPDDRREALAVHDDDNRHQRRRRAGRRHADRSRPLGADGVDGRDHRGAERDGREPGGGEGDGGRPHHREHDDRRHAPPRQRTGVDEGDGEGEGEGDTGLARVLDQTEGEDHRHGGEAGRDEAVAEGHRPPRHLRNVPTAVVARIGRGAYAYRRSGAAFISPGVVRGPCSRRSTRAAGALGDLGVLADGHAVDGADLEAAVAAAIEQLRQARPASRGGRRPPANVTSAWPPRSR